LAKDGHSPSKMGLILRDHHGIPKIRAFGSRLEKYMSENKIKFKNEREILEQKVAKIKTQVDANKQDKSARKALIKHSWKLSRLISQY
jgi:ribosomal protein S15P/S13E